MVISSLRLSRGLVAAGVACAVSCVDLSYEPGIAVDVVLERRAETRRTTTNLGFEVELDEAFLTIESIELAECPSAELPFGIGVAHAHSSATRTRLASPLALDLASERPRLVYGALTPAPSSFCSARVTFGPADSDASGMPPDGRLVGRTLLVEGRFRRGAEGAWTPLSIAASLTQTVSVPIARMHLDSPRAAEIVIAFEPRWLDDVALDDASAAVVALEHLAAGVAEAP